MTTPKQRRATLTIAAVSCVVSLVFAGDSPELARLRDSYKAAIENATKPLTQTYLAELERLRDNFTRAAKLEAANGVQAEIDAIHQGIAFAKAGQKMPTTATQPTVVAPPAAAGAKVKIPEAKWFVDRSWWTDGRQEFAFGQDGKGRRTARGGGQAQFTWRLLPSGLVEVAEEPTKPGASPELWYFRFDSKSKASIGKSESSLPWIVTDK